MPMPPRRRKRGPEEEDGPSERPPPVYSQHAEDEGYFPIYHHDDGPSNSTAHPPSPRPHRPKRHHGPEQDEGSYPISAEHNPAFLPPVLESQLEAELFDFAHTETSVEFGDQGEEEVEMEPDGIIVDVFGEPEPIRPQGASVAMKAALPHFPKIQDIILDSFAARKLGSTCSCGVSQPEATIYRCRDCFKPKLSCASCMISQHAPNPFHQIERWNGKHFERLSLHLLGFRLYTCPRTTGKRCPEVSEHDLRTQRFTMYDSNGIHELDVEYCSCTAGIGAAPLPYWEQLHSLQLFPASFTQPKTAFTWRVLKQFHIHSMTSKKSAYDFVKALCKLTDNAFSPNVTDRYREFQFVYRIWRYLALVRRSGQAFGINDVQPEGRRSNSLVVRCPACPEANFNVDLKTIDEASGDEQHKYTLFLSADGNFKLRRKKKKGDPEDLQLNNGNAYFVESSSYKKYIKVVKPVAPAGTCAHLRAARLQNHAKFNNTPVTGVIAIQCARHGFFLRLVDLFKGESFRNTDYALAYVLVEALLLRWIFMTYDIWCQFVIHLLDRFEEHFPQLREIISKIRGSIPKMHIHNHNQDCQLEWNLNWMLFVALTVGELIETAWAELNLTAGSTREMNDGNRHDSIDDFCGHWNWDKLVLMASALQ
ncbi:hypothetical protein MIND_01124200 [Mycena indigotica]|uniref:CxC2-like cysteine cluster KDZ transposase-associated domain-containing protein n=1 Tax=Mycena indigotica TaxID=2126181 RepID=A0A8H6S5H2_9AGAR|nr:uncharacterized protein MIND_01124200 [Mycena indigotica]KAF7293465.1 hypothetical protein MIND_01124200 [Mycena indigotica]